MPEPSLTIYFDGDCRMCRGQSERYSARDNGRGLLLLVDITEPGFDPTALGTTREAMTAQIHALTPGGELLIGMAALRRAASVLGRGWLLAPTGWPALRPVCDLGYRWLAKHRYRLGGRCDEDSCRPRG